MLSSETSQGWKAKTYDVERVRKPVKRHLYPFFGLMAIEEITRDTIQDFLNGKSEYARKTIREMLMVLGMVLECAVEDGIISRNPERSNLLKIPSTRKRYMFH